MAQLAPHASVASNSIPQAPLRIFYDRLAVAVLGCLAVLAFLIGGPLAMAGVFSGVIPLVGLLLSLASFSTLRALAVRDRRAKLLARMAKTRELAMEVRTTEHVEPRKKQAVVFDAQPNSNKQAPRLTVQELRAEALRIANNGAALQRPEGWELIEVPLPQYVVANAAALTKRPSPAPLQPAAAPKASSNASLRSQEAAARLAEALGTTEVDAALPKITPAPDVPAAVPATASSIDSEPASSAAPAVITAAGTTSPATSAAAEQGPETEAANTARAPRTDSAADRINLDDVMQRRRA